MRKYEATIVLSKTIDDAEVEKRLDPVKQAVSELGGKVESVVRMGRNTLARPFKKSKQDTGVFALMTMQISPDSVADFHDKLKYNNDILRMQVIAIKKPAAPSEPEKEEKKTPSTEES